MNTDKLSFLLASIVLSGVFVIDSPHCGAYRLHPQQALEHLQEGRYDQALLEIRRALREGDDTPIVRLIAAMVYLEQNQIEKAVRELGMGLRLDPDEIRLHRLLRDICQQNKCFDLAREVLEDLDQQYPDNLQILSELGWIYAQLGNEEKAIELLARAVDREVDDLFAYLQLGHLYLNQNRFDAAIAVVEQGLAVVPNDPDLLLLLGQCRFFQGQFEIADRTFAQALEQSNSPLVIAVRIAQFYYEQGQRRQAIVYYERAMQEEKVDPLVFNNLAWAYAEEGIRLDYALELATRAVKKEPDNVVYLDTYAELFYRKGKPARAIAVMRRALELEPAEGQHRAYLQGQMEKFQQAQSVSPF